MLLLAVFSHVWNFSFLPQIEGAFIQGMGLYTIEELNYSPQGVLYTRGPNQYKIPAICDIPMELHISFSCSSPSPLHSLTPLANYWLGKPILLVL